MTPTKLTLFLSTGLGTNEMGFDANESNLVFMLLMPDQCQKNANDAWPVPKECYTDVWPGPKVCYTDVLPVAKECFTDV